MLMLSVCKVEKAGYWHKMVIAMILFAFLIIGGFGQGAVAAEKGPIKIGFIATTTGIFGQLGIDMISGIRMALDENNNMIAGRKVEMIVEDEQNPQVAVTKARKLIAHDKVHFIAGVLISPAAYAISPICEEAKIPFFDTQASGDDLTQRKRTKYTIRLAQTAGEAGHVAGDFTYRKLGWKKANIIAFDYAWGHESAGGFQRVFEDAGGQVIQKVWVPINAMDFGPYVAGLNREADGVFDNVTGAASIRLTKLLREGAKPWEVIGNGPLTDETMHEALGQACVGVYSSWPYSIALQLPQTVKWKERARRYLGREPNGYTMMQYSCIDWIIRAIKKVNGNVEDKEKFLNAVRSMEIPDSIRGPLKLDKYGEPIQNYYIRRLDKIGEGYQNTVVETYPNVSQFWKYDPEEFLKQPVYSRDYPPCKFCK